MIPENYALERVDVSALSGFAGNPRTHSDGQIDQIAASIREFGWTNPILVDADGTIIAGHGRLEAAKRLQLREVPVIRLAEGNNGIEQALRIECVEYQRSGSAQVEMPSVAAHTSVGASPNCKLSYGAEPLRDRLPFACRMGGAPRS